MKFFTMKTPKEPTQQDELKLRLLRQQITANETQKILNQITDQEYRENLERCAKELEELEAKYGISHE